MDMRKLFFAACILLMVLPFASATLTADDVHLSRIRIGDYGYVSGGYMDSYVFVFNSNTEDTLWDGRVTVRVLDADVYGSSNLFDVKYEKGVSQSLYADTDGTAPGEYLVKVTYSNGDLHKTKYRYVTIE
jgi:hypothetical protein